MDHASSTEVYYHQTPRCVLLMCQNQQSESKEWTLVMKEEKTEGSFSKFTDQEEGWLWKGMEVIFYDLCVWPIFVFIVGTFEKEFLATILMTCWLCFNQPEYWYGLLAAADIALSVSVIMS